MNVPTRRCVCMCDVQKWQKFNYAHSKLFIYNTAQCVCVCLYLSGWCCILFYLYTNAFIYIVRRERGWFSACHGVWDIIFVIVVARKFSSLESQKGRMECACVSDCCFWSFTLQCISHFRLHSRYRFPFRLFIPPPLPPLAFSPYAHEPIDVGCPSHRKLLAIALFGHNSVTFA